MATADGHKARGGHGGGCGVQAWRGLVALTMLALLHLAAVTLQQRILLKKTVKRWSSEPRKVLPGLPQLPQRSTALVQPKESQNPNALAINKPKRDLITWVNEVASLQELVAMQELRKWLEQSRATVKVTHQIEKEASRKGWHSCALESELCTCASGQVRYGDPEKNIWVEATGKTSITCNTPSFENKDVAPGKVKSCECMLKSASCPDGNPVDASRCPGDGEQICRLGCAKHKKLEPASSHPVAHKDLCSDQKPYELLWSCDKSMSRRPTKGHPHSEAQEVLDWAMEEMCHDDQLKRLAEVYLDCEFVDNYRSWTSKDSEWLDEAYVTYVAGQKDSKYEWQATNLIRSVHLFSSRPIIVFVYDDVFVPPVSWRALPGVIVYKMHPISRGVSFNFNKLRAMIAARAIQGIQLDTDQIIFTQMDQVFNGTRREIDSKYPWPIMPVHWMSRDDFPGQPYKAYVFRLYKDKAHTMRWNHAHPTWSFWAVPFLQDTLMERLVARLPLGGSVSVWRLEEAKSKGLLPLLRTGADGRSRRVAHYKGWMIEDEDMLNVALWRAGVDKAWCKFDIEPGLFVTRRGIEKKMYADPMWYPDGIPLLFISSHNTKSFEATDWLLNLLAHCDRRHPRLDCPEVDKNDLHVCKVGSTIEREARQDATAYASKVCCCIEPRWEQPIFWYGKWYRNMRDVPLKAPGGSGKDRRCVMP